MKASLQGKVELKIQVVLLCSYWPVLPAYKVVKNKRDF